MRWNLLACDHDVDLRLEFVLIFLIAASLRGSPRPLYRRPKGRRNSVQEDVYIPNHG